MIKTTRIGIINSAPTLVIEYLYSLDGRNVAAKQCHRHFRLHNLSHRTDSYAVSNLLLEEFPAYFSNVPVDQIRRMIDRIIESLSSSGPSPVEQQIKDDIAQLGDLNSVEADVLTQAKRQMDVLFNAAVIRPCDGGYKYDKKIDFDEPVDDCSWD